ncbi:MAG: divalent metal cation transporter [Acidobacteriales bacterium]|nr:divalent metal cation transporter [Terriglobales bacterium]
MPDIVSGAADLDPAAVLTITVVGAQVGLALAWVVALCAPILHTVFKVSGRIGAVTRKGLVQLVGEQYGKRFAIPLAVCVVAVNLLMIIGDIVAVSDAASILTRQPRAFFIAVIAFMVWYVLILGSYERVSSSLALMSLALLGYVVAAALTVDAPVRTLSQAIRPHVSYSSAYLMAVIAVFGALLTPDVLVWQTSSRRVQRLAAHTHSKVGTLVAIAVALSVLIAATNIKVADPSSLTTKMAAEALAPLGDIAPVIFAFGILGSGLVALPILVASLCFAVSEAFSWSSGLHHKPWEAQFFYVLISGTLALATVIDLVGINTITVLYWSQVLAGMVIMPILLSLYLLGKRVGALQGADRGIILVTIVAFAVANVLFIFVSIFR